MQYFAVVLEHVDLFDALNWVDGELLERRLQLFVVGRARLVDDLLLAAWHSLSFHIYHRK